jgi:DNA-binding CsgD family transcriptional regulator
VKKYALSLDHWFSASTDWKKVNALARESEKTDRFAGKGGVVSIGGLRRQNLPYLWMWVLYYAWVIVYATWWTASPLEVHVFGSGMRSLMHMLGLAVCALLVFLIRKEWFLTAVRIGALLLGLGMAIALLAPGLVSGISAAAYISVSASLVNMGVLIPFVFALNNTEKLYAAVISNLLINIVLLIYESASGILSSPGDAYFSFILLAAALAAVFFFRREAVYERPAEKSARPVEMRVYFTLFFNCIFIFLCKGAGKGLLNLAVENVPSLLRWYYVGGLAGCAVCLAVYALGEKSLHLSWNIVFAGLSMALLCNALANRIDGPVLRTFAVLLGLSSTVGIINMYYIIGVISKKYNSMRFLRLSICLIGICGGVAGIAVGNWINGANSASVSLSMSILSAGMMLLLLMLSPLLQTAHYDDYWVRDSERMEVNTSEPFAAYHLTAREAEVCRLLLEGYTLRQVSAMLCIAYSTANTYCTSLYRKLGINSRTELLLRFRREEKVQKKPPR